jgi:hypothetical protein
MAKLGTLVTDKLLAVAGVYDRAAAATYIME